MNTQNKSQHLHDELTLEQYAATLVWEITHPGQYHTLWLCSSEEHKAKRLALLNKHFEMW